MRAVRFNIFGFLLEINQKEAMNFFMTYGFFPERQIQMNEGDSDIFTHCISELSS